MNVWLAYLKIDEITNILNKIKRHPEKIFDLIGKLHDKIIKLDEKIKIIEQCIKNPETEYTEEYPKEKTLENLKIIKGIFKSFKKTLEKMNTVPFNRPKEVKRMHWKTSTPLHSSRNKTPRNQTPRIQRQIKRPSNTTGEIVNFGNKTGNIFGNSSLFG